MKRIAEAAILAALSISRASAQSPSLAFGLSHVVAAADGIARGCLESGYSTGADVRYLQPVFTRLTAIELDARAYIFGTSPTCVDGFPPQDGTYLQADRVNLLAESFVATDVRFSVRLSRRPGAIALALGLGNSWRARDNLPYFLVEAQVPAGDGGSPRQASR